MTKSTLPILEAYKTTRPKDQKSNRSDELHKQKGELLKSQLDAARLSYEVGQKTSEANPPYKEAMDNVKKSFGEKPEGWAAFGSGFIDGWNAESRKKSILDDKKRLKAFEDTLAKMEAYSLEAQGRLAEAQKKEEIKEGLSPYVSRTLDLIMEGAPQERIDLAGIDLARRLSAISGDKLEYAMGNGNGLTLRNPETGEDTYVTWEDLAAPNIQEKVMMANPVYQSQLLRQQQMEAHDMALQERDTAARELGAEAAMYRAKNGGSGRGAGILGGTKDLSVASNRIPDIAELPDIPTRQSYSQYSRDRRNFGQILQELEHIQSLYEDFRNLSKDDLVDPQSPYRMGEAANAVSDFAGVVLDDSKRKEITAKRKALDSMLSKFAVEMERKLKGGVLSDSMRKFFENKGVLPSLNDRADVFEEKMKALSHELERNYEASTLALQTGKEITPWDLNETGGNSVSAPRQESSLINPAPPEAQNDSQALQKKLEEINAKIEALTQQ